MAIYKIQNSPYWWVSLINPRTNQRIRKSTRMRDKTKAQAVEEQLMASIVLGQEHYMVTERQSYTWDMAVKRWFDEKKDLRDLRTPHIKAKWLHAHFKGKALESIDATCLKEIVRLRQQEASIATTNRYISFIRGVLNRAHKEWGWLDKMPHIPMQREYSKRVCFLEPEEAKALLEELPEHLKAMVIFTLNTGLRASNVYGLKWKQVNIDKQHLWINPEQAKAKKAIPVPLNTQALAVLKKQQGKHSQFVFTFKRKPIRTSPNNSAWIKALKRAKITNFRWHDLRHTWATWHIQAGTPMHVLQELGGWSSYDMVQRYAHLSSNHLRNYTNNCLMDS